MYWVHFMREFYKPVNTQSAVAARRAPQYAPAESNYEAQEISEEVANSEDASHSEIQYPLSAQEFQNDAHMAQVQEDVLFLASRLQSMQQALAVSDRGRSAFLSAMSHELRTPLNAIMGFADMMKSGVFGPIENPTYRQYVAHIHESGQLLLQKINDLLEIASMDADALTLSESECELNIIMQELVEIHSHKAFARQQSVKLDVPAHIRLHADKTKLLCALSHFVGNALRHSADNAQVLVRARVTHGDGLIVSVHDAGEGITAPQLEIIRQALQAELAYEYIECGGIGLGLSLSKEIATRHGGRVTIDSQRRHGTVVAMILPPERVRNGMPPRRRASDRQPNPVESGRWELI